MSVRNLRNLIRLMVEEVLGEPDLSAEEDRGLDKDKDKKGEEVDEQNTVASVAPGGMGPMMPLGVDSASYPVTKSKKKKRKSKKKKNS